MANTQGFPHALQKAIEYIESYEDQNDVVQQVLRLLNRWGMENKTKRRQIVCKRSLKHEIEECLPALQHLNDWRRGNRGTFVAVDVCGGKGVFSLLLKELTVTEPSWKTEGATLDKVILVEWAENIDWGHLECEAPGDIQAEVWRKCNVNDIDEVVDRLLQESNSRLVLTGIHLCGQLSLSFLSIVNGLGADRCPCFCLVPCCMPKEVLKNKPTDDRIRPAMLYVHTREDKNSRSVRIDIERRRLTLRKKLTKESPEGTLYPCWSCGRFGHRKAACTDPLTFRIAPPVLSLDVSRILRDPSPCTAYCKLLMTSLDGDWENRRLWETGIISLEGLKQPESNWNRDRKSIYLVASRTQSQTTTSNHSLQGA